MSDPTSVGDTADELTFSLDGRSVVAHKGFQVCINKSTEYKS